MALIGCSPGSDNVVYVSVDEYAHSPKCWRDNQGHLAAFVIFKEANGGYVPSFLPFKCAAEESGISGAQFKIENINAFRVKESQTNLQNFGFTNSKLYDNDSVEFVIPSARSKVYFIVASYSGKGRVAEISEFKSVVDTGIDFESFLRLSDGEIYELGSRLSRMSR